MNDWQMNDPYEATPLGFHLRVEQKLKELQGGKDKAARSFRWAAVLAACLVLMGGTALALERLGVMYFLTERTFAGDSAAKEAVVQPAAQHCDSALLNATLQDAYWDGSTLSISLNVQPKDASAALYLETDVGVDGEHFDRIWWKGEILPFDQWRAGRSAIELCLPEAAADIPTRSKSWDWVQDEQGETLLLQLEAEDMTQGAAITITLQSRVLDQDTVETATLTALLPAMDRADQKEEKEK